MTTFVRCRSRTNAARSTPGRPLPPGVGAPSMNTQVAPRPAVAINTRCVTTRRPSTGDPATAASRCTSRPPQRPGSATRRSGCIEMPCARPSSGTGQPAPLPAELLPLAPPRGPPRWPGLRADRSRRCPALRSESGSHAARGPALAPPGDRILRHVAGIRSDDSAERPCRRTIRPLPAEADRAARPPTRPDRSRVR